MIKLTKKQKSVIANRINQMIAMKSDIWDLMRDTERELEHDFSDFDEKISVLVGSGVDCTPEDAEWFINSLECDGE